MPSRHEVIENLIHKYERYVAPFTFAAGFVLDTITLRRVDLWLDQLALLGFLATAAIAITALNVYESGQTRLHILDSIIQFAPVVMQFAFGGLFSAFVIFYTKSAAFGKSWLFILALAVLLVGNERFRARYQRLTFQLSIFFVTVFSYSILILPIIVKKMGTAVFLGSGAMSAAIIFLFVTALSYIIPRQISEARRMLAAAIGGIYILFHLFYFTNIIPPIPLSLKESGVYHSVERVSDEGYAVRYEPAPWYAFLSETNSLYHWKSGELVYFFSSVFAPTKLTASIRHRWYYYDEESGDWTQYAEVPFPIYGGRDGGYRGYSFITGVRPGKWRVEAVVGRGQVLGREAFRIVEIDEEFAVQTGIK